MADIFDLADTWNNGATTFTAIKMDATDTASAADSLLLDLLIGGGSKFSVDKAGRITIPQSSAYDEPSFKITGFDTGIAITASTVVGLISNGTGVAGFKFNTGLMMKSTLPISWGNANINGSADTLLYRDAAGIIAQRNGTNAQTGRLYGSYTNSTNGRWFETAVTTAGVVSLTATGNGTGASGNVLHISTLPTSNPGAGILWNNAGTPAIGT
jgi:hypothetical protein